jgi:hypothetical protein
LDVGVYGSLKADYRNEMDAYMKRNPGKLPCPYNFHSLFNNSSEKKSTPNL